MSDVLHGNAGEDIINVSEDKTQVYGLKGHDTLVSGGYSHVLLIGGSGDDHLIMAGGNGTLSGGGGSDIFELNYSASKALSAVIEDFVPGEDKIVVNFAGSAAPTTLKSVSGTDVVWSDLTGNLNVTLKGVRDNDYFDGDAPEEAWEVLRLTNKERENPTTVAGQSIPEVKDLPWLTLSDGLMKAAEIRVKEITALGESGILDVFKHDRTDGSSYSSVFDDVNKHYLPYGENIHAGSSLASGAGASWIGSETHHKNILSINPNNNQPANYLKLGVGYNYDDTDPTDTRWYWEQLFGGSMKDPAPEPVDVSTVNLSVSSVLKFIQGDDKPNTISNTVFGATIDALGGNDSITNSGFNVSISGGNDNDTIDNSGSFTTINGGLGNDRINLNGAQSVLIQYKAGDGSDTISGFNASDTFSLSGGEYTPVTVGNDVVVSLGTDSVTFVDAASLETFSIVGGTRSKLYIGTLGNDSINVTGVSGAMIEPLGGNDTIDGFDTNDTLQIAGGSYTSLTLDGNLILSKGADTINILGAANLSPINIAGYSGIPVTVESALLIRGTEGADDLKVPWDNATVRALGGDDTITNNANNVSIGGGSGNDYVYNNDNHRTVYVYESGNDTIEGFNEDDTLNIGNYTYTLETIGSDILVSIIDTSAAAVGTVTLKDYPAGQEPNIDNPGYRPPSRPGEELYDDGDYSFITGTDGDDTITNTSSYVTIDALGGNDSIENRGYTEDDSSYNYGVSINAGDGYDTVSSYSNNSTILGGAGNDSIDNHGSSVLAEGGAGNDTLYNFGGGDSLSGSNATLNGGSGNDLIHNYANAVTMTGGAGNDTITDYGNSTISIDGGAGKDTVENRGDNVSINGGSGNDSISNEGTDVTIIGGDGSDTIANKTVIYATNNGGRTVRPDSVSINGGAGNDSIDNTGSNVTIGGGDGNDSITNTSGDSVSMAGGADDDFISNNGSLVTITAGTGNDSVSNTAANVSISGGDGNDYLSNSGANVTILGEAGNDIIQSSGANVSILGGTGSDRISLSGSSQDNFLRYSLGDGNDTVWGIGEDDTFNFLLDNSLLTSVGSGNDLIINVRTGGSITFIDGRNHPPKFTFGESGTSGGISGEGDSPGNPGGGGGTSTGGNDGGNDSSGGNTSGGTSSREGRASAASGGRSASGLGRNEHSTTENASTGNSNALPEAVTQLTHRNTSTTTQETSTTSTRQHVYTGGNQVISDYAAGEKIVFGATYTGAFYDGNGDFFAGSTTGALVVQNAMNKVVDLTDAAGNAFVKAYAATTAGIIDGRGLGGFEVINGSAGADAIYAGDGGSQLWGGADVASDAMMGGGGTDIFIGGKNQGADYFLNASSADIVHLNDSTLSDIVATAEENGTIGIAFNTGNVIAVQSSEALSATVMLADGSAYKYNHANKSWQSA